MRTPKRECAGPQFAYRPGAIAAAVALLLSAALPARAQLVTPSGDVSPIFVAAPVVDLTGQRIFVGFTNAGVGTSGSLSISGGGSLTAAELVAGVGGLGTGTVSVSGAGSVFNLTGDGNANRLDLGSWGSGVLTVSGGATLNARANATACLIGSGFCNNFIGNAAGSDATFTVTGAGSNASFLNAFVVGGVAVFRPPTDTFTFGTPGGSTTGRVNVLAGGTLTTDSATLGVGPGGSSPLGTERSTALVVIDGVGSVWRVTGGTLNGSQAGVQTAAGPNATATIRITNGGQMVIDGPRVGPSGDTDFVNLTSNGLSTVMTIDGAGSRLLFNGDGGALQVGRRGAGSATLDVLNGGTISGMHFLSVGRDGATGTLTVAGAGSEVAVNGTASAAFTGGPFEPYMVIGRGGGSGTVNVTNGGRVTMVSQGGSSQSGVTLDLARDTGSSGTLNISGAGSVVSLSQASLVPGGGPTEAVNPQVRIGREGTGTLNITDGGKLLVDSQAVSTVADPRVSRIQIGGNNSTSTGGTGTALVSGPGSEIRMTGFDTLIDVGRGAQSSGTLTVQNGASVSAIGMLVGNFGGTGTVDVNNAALNFSGQQTGDQLAGAFLAIGRGGGTGTVNVTNGSVVNLTNAGSAGASLTLGGSSIAPTGNGTLNVTNSTVNVIASSGLAQFRVGRDGTGTSTFANSTLNVSGATADNSQVLIAALPGSTGTLTLSAGSVINAGYVGVGATPSTTPGVQNLGGQGTLIVNDSTVNAISTFEIGALGVLAGNNGVINVRNGDVIIGGTISPGESPGRIRINCNLISLDGSRLILEVQDNGSGYDIDQLIIGDDSTFDLRQFEIVFSFLGDTDPTAFAASGGFDLDNFLLAGHFNGDPDDPLSTLFAAGQTWADVVDFSRVTAESGVFDVSLLSFDGIDVVAAPIPEPSTWALMLVGLLFIASRARALRRASGAVTPRGPVAACS
jgi:T5SS/PEP-CTERM-associated repeat protein